MLLQASPRQVLGIPRGTRRAPPSGMGHPHRLSYFFFVCCAAACTPVVGDDFLSDSGTSDSTSESDPTADPTGSPTTVPTGNPTTGPTSDPTTDGPDSSSTGPGSESDSTGPGDCGAWRYAEFVDDPSRATAYDRATVPDGLVLAGSPTQGAVGLYATDGGTEWTYTNFVGADSLLVVLDVPALDDGSLVVGGRRTPLSGPDQGVDSAWIAQLEADGSVAWEADAGGTNYVVWAHLDVLAHPDGGLVLSITGVDGELRTV